MPIHRVYRLRLERLTQFQPDAHHRRLVNFAWLIAGIYISQFVHLSGIARKLPGQVKLPRVAQKLHCLLMNRCIHVRN